MALENPETGILETDHDNIKKVAAKYVENLLSKGPPKKGSEEIYKLNRKLHEERMREKVPNDLEDLTNEQFEDALKLVANKHKSKYRGPVKHHTDAMVGTADQ